MPPVAHHQPRRELNASRDSTSNAHAHSASVHLKQPGNMSYPTVDLWEAVMADAMTETLTEDPCATVASRSDLSAEVLNHKERCLMTFQRASDRLKVVRLSSKAHSKEKTILYVPMHAVLNVETADERDRRQRMHVANDETTQLNLKNGSHPADKYLCSFAEMGSESLVYEHSRVNTLASTASGGLLSGGSSHHNNASTSSYPSQGMGPSGPIGSGPFSSHSRSVSGAARSLPNRYFVHYTKVEKAGSRKSIHTMELTVSDDVQQLEATFTLVKALLRRIYLSGPKKLIAFISPKSGTGQGKEVFNSQVKPFLHFSRHSVHVIMTRRAHDAEDYLADLDHYMDGNYVAVAVGGDGMMHEVVNGLHRRKQQLMKIIREECRRRVACSGTSQAATLTQVRPLGLSIDDDDVCENEEEDDEDNSSGTQEKKKSRREMGTENGETDSLEKTLLHGGGNEEAEDSTITKSNHHNPHHSCDNKSALTLDTMKFPVMQSQQQPRQSRSRHTDPLGASSSMTPSALGAYHSNPSLSPSSMPLIPDRRRPCEVSFASYVTNLFLTKGWEGLLPMTATIPTGSACGLAKSLDVLSVTQAAVALVHLSACPQDLLDMRFAPNADLLAYHKNSWSRKKAKHAEEAFRKYQHRNREELAEREAAAKLSQGQQHAEATAEGGSKGGKAEVTHHRHRNAALLPNAGSANGVASEACRPFLNDGSAAYTNAVSMAVGAPDLPSRVAFMSLSFGVANDIDHGSEHLRWMGNARFTLYGGYVLMKGITTYETTLRYLPWEDTNGLKLEKLHEADRMPSPSQLPRCTMKADCPHCLDYLPPESLLERTRQHTRPSQSHQSSDEAAARRARDEHRRRETQRGMREFYLADHGVVDTAAVASASDAVLMGETEIDFDDESLPWVVIRCKIYSMLICSLRDVAQDMMMAPLSHMSDGAIDIVFSRVDTVNGKGGRKEFFQYFAGLESGDHVNQWFTNYVKARAVEVKVDGGLSMSDGEMMPLSSVRLTKLRSAVRMVRNEE